MGGIIVNDIYLTMEEVAKRLGVGQDKVRELIRTGKLAAIRLGYRTIRISESALIAYTVKASKANAKGQP
jgi:excisionase family DNA binding protein